MSFFLVWLPKTCTNSCTYYKGKVSHLCFSYAFSVFSKSIIKIDLYFSMYYKLTLHYKITKICLGPPCLGPPWQTQITVWPPWKNVLDPRINYDIHVSPSLWILFVLDWFQLTLPLRSKVSWRSMQPWDRVLPCQPMLWIRMETLWQ